MSETYFDIWYADKNSMLDTMVKNMTADLDAGYNYFGDCIQRQIKAIDDYKKSFDNDMKWLGVMDEKQGERWCKFDLLRRGVITA